MPQPLTPTQKSRLSRLEPRLKKAVEFGNYELAKDIALDIQDLLRGTGHETRLMLSKNWLFEAAIEAGDYETAERGLNSVRTNTKGNTRVHLEATALLAICYLRQGKTQLAEPLMEAVLKNDKVIKSSSRRTQFRLHIIRRFEEEGVLNALRNSSPKEVPDPKEVQDEAGNLLMKNTSEDDLLTRIGIASPPDAVAIILKIDDFSRKRLPLHEVKLLPSPDARHQQKRVGTTVTEALKRRLYAVLCDKDSDVYQSWINEGLGTVLNKLYIGGAVSAMLVNMSAGTMALAVPLTAMVLKAGIGAWCELNKPANVMIR